MWHKFTNYRFIEHFNFANRLADEHTHTHTNKVLTIRAVIGRSLWRRSTLPVCHSQEPSLCSLLLQLATAAFSTSRSQLILQSFWRVAPSVSFVSAYTESTGGGIFYFFFAFADLSRGLWRSGAWLGSLVMWASCCLCCWYLNNIFTITILLTLFVVATCLLLSYLVWGSFLNVPQRRPARASFYLTNTYILFLFRHGPFPFTQLSFNMHFAIYFLSHPHFSARLSSICMSSLVFPLTLPRCLRVLLPFWPA